MKKAKYRSKGVETWLPVFPGFYNTIFDDTDRYQNPPEDIAELINEDFEPEYDYKQYFQDYSREITSACYNLLKDFVYDIEFQALESPKEYNFRNDSINCVIYPKNRSIKAYVNANFAEFDQYCKDNFTSCSGFISFHSNKADEWKVKTDNFTKWNEFTLGAILDFILRNEESDPEEALFYSVIDIPYLPCYADYSECEGMIELVKKHVQSEYGRNEEIKIPEDFQDFQDKINIDMVVKQTIQEIEKHTLNLF